MLFLVEVPSCGNIAPLGFRVLLSIILEAAFLLSNSDFPQMTGGNEQNHFKSSHALEQQTDPRIMRQNGGKNPQGNYPYREANIPADDWTKSIIKQRGCSLLRRPNLSPSTKTDPCQPPRRLRIQLLLTAELPEAAQLAVRNTSHDKSPIPS